MAKISGEIHKWCAFNEDTFIDNDDCNELRAIADRIDAEMVELPRDRDGVPIHVDDKVWDARGGHELFVNGINMEGGGIGIRVYDDGVMWDVIPPNLTHARPYSWERIADDIEGSKSTVFIEGSTLSEWAERIRKLAKEDK